MKLYQPFKGTPRVTQWFGGNASYYAQFGQKGHNGIDYGIASGTPVLAAADGVIDFEGFGKNEPLAGAVAGIYILLEHSQGWTGYAHLNRTIVNKGQKVTRGQVIAYSGASGTVTGAHLHFEYFPDNYKLSNGYYGRVDPKPLLDTAPPAPPKPPAPPTDPCLQTKKDLAQCQSQLEAEKRLTEALSKSNNELIAQNNELVDDLADNNEENKQLLLDIQDLEMQLAQCKAGQTCPSFWEWVKCKTNKK